MRPFSTFNPEYEKSQSVRLDIATGNAIVAGDRHDDAHRSRARPYESPGCGSICRTRATLSNASPANDVLHSGAVRPPVLSAYLLHRRASYRGYRTGRRLCSTGAECAPRIRSRPGMGTPALIQDVLVARNHSIDRDGHIPSSTRWLTRTCASRWFTATSGTECASQMPLANRRPTCTYRHPSGNLGQARSRPEHRN